MTKVDEVLKAGDVIKHECARVISMYCGVDASDKIAKAVKEINVVELLRGNNERSKSV